MIVDTQHFLNKTKVKNTNAANLLLVQTQVWMLLKSYASKASEASKASAVSKAPESFDASGTLGLWYKQSFLYNIAANKVLITLIKMWKI